MTAPASKLTSSIFWQYSTRRYASNDMAPLSLLLQDNHGVNVNVLLLMCWCLENNVIVNLIQMKAIVAAIAESDKQLQAHRLQRKAAHPDNGGQKAHYEALKERELELEKQQQAVIVEAFNSQDVMTLPSGSLNTKTTIFNASIAAFINAYALKDSEEARQLLSLVVNQLPN